MAEWRIFAYKGAPETCWWCGRKLRRRTMLIQMTEDIPHGYHLTGHTGKDPYGPVRTVAADKLGDYQDDKFCGLRCGYQFGDEMAQRHRLIVRTNETPT
jgi:hypothetical protein